MKTMLQKSWYISPDCDRITPHGTIVKDPDPHSLCLLAASSINDALLCGGFREAVYEVTGVPCNHGYPREYWYSIMVANGGYVNGCVDLTYTWGERAGPFTFPFPKDHIALFDSLRIVAALTTEVFGPNGRQVIHALHWWRSKFELVNGRIDPIRSMKAAFDRAWAYYDDRIANYGGWWNSGNTDDPFVRAKNSAHASKKLWLQPQKLVDAWNECHLAAAKTRRAIVCEWLETASVGLVALCLRDQIGPKAFAALWEGTEEIIPLAELDRQVPPVLYESS